MDARDLARRAVAAGGAVFRGVVPARGPRVLLYHRVEPDPRPGDLWSVSIDQLAEHLRELRAMGIPVVPSSALVDGPARDEATSVVLAFDDGYRSVVDHALPVLRDAGVPATFFLVPRWMGAVSEWERAAGTEPRPLMRWDDAVSLLDAGMAVGSHSFSHADMTTLDDASLATEVERSKDALEAHLRREVVSFSVPYGRDDPRLDAALERAGYRLKITNAEAVPRSGPGLRVRPCVAVLSRDDVAEFRRKVAGAYDWLHASRRWRRRLARLRI